MHVCLICYISIAVVYRIIGEEGWNPIMWSNPVTVVCLSQDLDYPTSYVVVFFIFYDLMSKMIVGLLMLVELLTIDLS